MSERRMTAYDYPFFKKRIKQIVDVDVERGAPPDGAFTLVSSHGELLAAYRGLSWVEPHEDGYDHVASTVVWVWTYRDAVALSEFVLSDGAFPELRDGVQFAVFQMRMTEGGLLLDQRRPFTGIAGAQPPPPPPAKEPSPESRPENPTAVGEQWQDNAVPGPDIPENRKDDEEVPQ